MLKLLKPANPEDLFVQRYDLLLGWALSLTSHNQAQAEDLVHDAFIQFTHRRGDLAAIENTDAYLNRMLRNMYLSQVRRAGLIQDSRFSIADFDSAEMGLRTFRANDQREHLDLQDELRQICQYACARKETSKAGSVLILRFFHGYYPSEIAQVLHSTRMAVDRWLQISRREAKAYLVDPRALKFMAVSQASNLPTLGYARTTTELIGELLETIFASRSGDCLSLAQMRERYREKTTIDGDLLSHVVSCSRCLDAVNRLLGLPLLAERSSDDRLGRDVPPDKSGGGSGEGGTGGSIVESKKKYQRRLKEVMEHRPQELRIAVNGFVLGSQQVSSELSKLALTVNVDEPIGFIEVFSEQGVRLLFFDVDQPTDGSIEQSAGVDFDCGRALDLSLSFRGPWPAVNVSYHDPTFDAVESTAGMDAEVFSEALIEAKDARSLPTLWSRSGDWIRSLFGALDWRLFLRPGAVTALFALVLMAMLVFFYRHVPNPSLSATSLLERAAAAEDLVANNRDQMSHRTVQLEERSATGQLLASRRIDIWHSPEKGITARRLYDERGSLIAGDWRRADGVQTLYSHGRRPQLQPAPGKQGDRSPILSFDNVWQVSPTAAEFASLIQHSEKARVEERSGSFVVYYENQESVTSGRGLVKTSLTLSRSDLHSTELTVVVRSDEANPQIREYRFVETSFERRPTNAVAPAVFEPDAELMSWAPPNTPGPTPGSMAPTTGPQPPTPVVATPALEVEVLGLLNGAGAFMGEQLRVTRTSEGKLIVAGLVDMAERKAELLRALATVRNNPAVRVEVETAAEAAQRERPKSSGNITVDRVEATEGTSPVYAELRKKFSDDDARRFADRILSRSLQARSHALALKQLAGRFSQTDLQTLSAADRERWLALLRDHAQAYEREVEVLRRELQSVFPAVGATVSATEAMDNDAQIQQAALRLYELSVSCDESLRQSFALSANGKGGAAVNTAQFWQSLKSAEALALRIARAR
jgi:RNA polymerase sigma factor (sigma-70 family)